MTDINKINNTNKVYAAENIKSDNRIYYKTETPPDTFVSSQKQPKISFFGRFSSLFNKKDKSNNNTPKTPCFIRLGNKTVDYNTLSDKEKHLVDIFQSSGFNFGSYLVQLYYEFREIGKYVNADNYIGNLQSLQRYIDGNNDRSLTDSSIKLLRQNGWVYRIKNNAAGNNEGSERISLNVKGADALIAELDRFMSTGEYFIDGRKYKVNNLTDFSYKTPDKISKWGDRVDPITMYFSGKINDETILALANITSKYKRGSIKNPINDLADWISKDKNITRKDVSDLIKFIRTYNGTEELAQAIEAEVRKYNGILSYGQYYAALTAFNRLIEYNKLVNQ